MGMAASQARFLGLTARKTNIEFEGQQINQQRTTLANQSANYYNDLLGMSVPVPPSVDNYTKTVYTFNDGAITNTITSLIVDSKNQNFYKVSYLSQYEDDFAIVSAATSVVSKNGNDYLIGSQKLRKMDGTTAIKADANDPYLKDLNDDQLSKLKDEESHYLALLKEKYGADTTWYVRYVQNTSTGAWQPYFYNGKNLTDGTTSNNNIISNVDCYTIGSATVNNEIKGKSAQVEKDSTGRYINITIYDNDNQNPVTYSLTTTTLTDEDAYNDAMNQYEYDKYLYDQTIQDINSKIEIIQAEDKNLELRLKQLDTEQDAISTEMDAVEKVIEKNTESSFKTFG